MPFPSSMGLGLLRPLQRLFFSGYDTFASQSLCCPSCGALALQWALSCPTVAMGSLSHGARSLWAVPSNEPRRLLPSIPAFPFFLWPMLSQFTFQLFLSLCAAISFTEDLVMAVVSGSSLCPPVPPWHLPLMSICGTVQRPGTSFKLIPGMC